MTERGNNMKKFFKKTKEKLPLTVSLVMASVLISASVLAVTTVVSHCIVGY